jgi:chitinase
MPVATSWFRRLAVLSLLLTLASPRAGADDAPPARVFVGYLYGPARNLDFKLYTHICHAFVTAGPDGTLNAGRNVPDPKLAEEAHRAGVDLLISLGGWGWDEQFAAITKSPEAEDRYVAAVLALLRSSGYDGLDLDWEYPDTADEVAGFERLARRFRKELDTIGRERGGKHLWLTFAASSNRGTLRWLETPFLVEVFDWINVMTYDMAGDWTDYAGHNAPLKSSTRVPGGRGGPSVEATFAYLLDERKFPPDRLALGIPLYGRGFAVKEPYASTKDAPRTRLPRGDFSNLAHLQADEGWKRVWDDEAGVPWLLSPDGKAVFGYDDPQSARSKGEWARARGLRGVFFWQINADRMPDGSNPVQSAARAGLFDTP